MPNIHEYTSPVNTFQPSEAGAQALGVAAHRTEVEYNEAGRAIAAGGAAIAQGAKDLGFAAVSYMEHREISHGAATFAQLNDNLTQLWNDTAKKADPNDPTVAARFREEVLEPALENYRKAFITEGGQRWSEGHIASLRNHMFEKTAADMSTLAADAVAVNVDQTANSLSNTAMRDPSSVQHLLDSSDSLVGGIVESAPNLKGAAAAKARMQLTEKMKEGIVKAGAIGAIQKAADPEKEADRWGEKFPQYISGADLKTLSANARQQIRARNYDYEMNRRREKEVATDASNEATDQYLINIHSRDPRFANDPVAQKIINDPNLLKADKSRLIGYIQRQLKPETDAHLSRETFTGLLRDLRDPNVDPDKVMQKAWDARLTDPGKKGSLSESDFNSFRKEVIDRKTPDGAALGQDRDEFFKKYAGTIDGYLAREGLHSALGSQKIYEAQQTAKRLEQVLKQKGQDPHSLYDPGSPNFFGRPENLRKFMVSAQDAHAYEVGLLNPDKAKGTVNLTGPNKTEFRTDVVDIPDGMSPAEALKRFGPGPVKLKDGRTKVLQ